MFLHYLRRLQAITHRYIGRRGAVLILLACVDIAYGTAMIISRPVTMRYAPTWWPASLGVLAGVSVRIWGIVWVVVGLFLITGIFRIWRGFHGARWQFATEVALKSWWALAAFWHWWKFPSPGGWGPAATYLGVAGLVILVTGWQEPPERSDEHIVR